MRKIKEKEVSFSQLCWRCAKACNKNLCVWVRTLEETPKGCVKNEKGRIVECPEFVDDELRHKKTNRQTANEHGLSEKSYYKFNKKIPRSFSPINSKYKQLEVKFKNVSKGDKNVKTLL